MTNFPHQVLRKHRALQDEFLKVRDAQLDAAVATERRDGEPESQTIARMLRADHPAIFKFYGLEVA